MALIDVVKYNGGPNVFAWKFPSDELSTFTQLIVNESQEAILVKDGQFADIFKAGRYRQQQTFQFLIILSIFLLVESHHLRQRFGMLIRLIA